MLLKFLEPPISQNPLNSFLNQPKKRERLKEEADESETPIFLNKSEKSNLEITVLLVPLPIF